MIENFLGLVFGFIDCFRKTWSNSWGVFFVTLFFGDTIWSWYFFLPLYGRHFLLLFICLHVSFWTFSFSAAVDCFTLWCYFCLPLSLLLLLCTSHFHHYFQKRSCCFSKQFLYDIVFSCLSKISSVNIAVRFSFSSLTWKGIFRGVIVMSSLIMLLTHMLIRAQNALWWSLSHFLSSRHPILTMQSLRLLNWWKRLWMISWLP